MIEYYGWINISDNAYETNDMEMNRIIKVLNKEIKKFDIDNRILTLKCINGNIILSLAGAANHKSSDVIEILNFYKRIPDIAIGSYGVLYLLDDEGESPDTFKIFKIAKGKISIENDTLLSPCSLKIFD